MLQKIFNVKVVFHLAVETVDITSVINNLAPEGMTQTVDGVLETDFLHVFSYFWP